MSTDDKEIESLAAQMVEAGASVSMELDNVIRKVWIRAKGIGSGPMAPIAAAERMREWLANRNPTIRAQTGARHYGLIENLRILKQEADRIGMESTAVAIQIAIHAAESEVA